jgi:hypothetical protein
MANFTPRRCLFAGGGGGARGAGGGAGGAGPAGPGHQRRDSRPADRAHAAGRHQQVALRPDCGGLCPGRRLQNRALDFAQGILVELGVFLVAVNACKGITSGLRSHGGGPTAGYLRISAVERDSHHLRSKETVSFLHRWYGRCGPHLAAYQRGAPAGGSAEGALLPPGRVPRSDFTSNKLAPKLAQQLKVGSACQAMWRLHAAADGFGRITVLLCTYKLLADCCHLWLVGMQATSIWRQQARLSC